MASEDQRKEKEGPTDLLTAPFQWGAVLSAVKDQIPSMDSDISISDGEEDGELFIFQRDQTNLIPDLSEELEDLPPEEAHMQKTFAFMRHPREIWSEDAGNPTVQKDKDVFQSVSGGHVLLGRDGFGLLTEEMSSQQAVAPSEFPTDEHKPGEGISGVLPKKEQGVRKDKDTHPCLSLDMPPSAEVSAFWRLNTSEKERRELIETKILSKAKLGPSSGDVDHPQPKNNNNNLKRVAEAERKPAAISAEHPRELTLFAFKEIEKWDLDKVLQDLETQSDDHASWSAKTACPSMNHETFRVLSPARLMGKLEELSLKQSRAFFSHRRRCLAKLPPFNKCQGDGRDVPIPAPLMNGRSLTPVELQRAPEPPTIYIDLRDAIPQRSELLDEEKGSSSDSSTDDEEGTEATGQETAEEGMKEFPQPSRKDCTGKSFLLQQLRNFRRKMSQSLAVAQERGESQNLMSPEEIDRPNVRGRRNLKLRGLTSVGPVHLESTTKSFFLLDQANRAATPSRETEKRPHSESPQDHSAGKDIEQPRTEESQKENQVKEKLKKQRLQEQLEKSKPGHSTTGKQPMAEETPVLFHAEASYLAPIDVLPTLKGTESEMLMMTIWLASCGQVAPCIPQSSLSPGTSLAAASIYPAVVTWLLSLVPCVEARQDSKAPFQVLGLQQAWHEDGLALRACLTPAKASRAQSTSRLRRHKELVSNQKTGLHSFFQPENLLQGTSLFYHQTSTFLSQTSLFNVIQWKVHLDSQLQNQSCLFLPEIPAIRLDHIAILDSDSTAVEKAFAVPAGLCWQTIETDEKYFPGSSDIRESNDMDTEVAIALLFETLLQNPVAVHHLLQLILASGLDICGLRLLYPQYNMFLSTIVAPPSSYTPDQPAPLLALSLRGPKARSALQDIMGPSDPRLAKVTDCSSINAIYCSSRAEPLAYLPHTDSRVQRELCFWFGGRACCEEQFHGGVRDPVCKCNEPRPSSHKTDVGQEKSDLQDTASSRRPATLVATTKGDIILLASPAVLPHTYGVVISTCTRRGFVLQGTKQLQLSPKQALTLGMPTSQVTAFCPRKTSCAPARSFLEDGLGVQMNVHCLALLLRKENAAHHVPALLKGLMSSLAEKGFLEEIQSSLHSSVEPEHSLCFHVVPYTDCLLQELGGNFSTVPVPCHIPIDVLRSQSYASDPGMEQVVLLTFTGMEAMKSAGGFLHQILALGYGKQQAQTPVSEEFDPRFELLALKWLPCLTRIQAKEVTPFEVGDKSWQPSISILMSSPALVCALRRIGAFVGLAEILKTQTQHCSKWCASSGDLRSVMALTPEMAFRQAALFFTEGDFVGDPKRCTALRYLPPPGRHPEPRGGDVQGSHADSLFLSMQAGAQILCTVLLIKPGTWAHNLAKILRKLDLEKFSLVGMKHKNLTPEDVEALLSPEAKQDPAALEAHSSHLTSGSSFVLGLQRENAVKKLLDLLGPEDPKQAQSLNPFFWRAQYGHSSAQNGFYGSTSYCVAVRDIQLFFPEGLCGAEYPALEEEEISTVKFDPVACLEFDKQRKIAKWESRRQLNLLGPQTLECPRLTVLCQTTCLILPGATRQEETRRPPYLLLLEQLISKGFLVTGARLTVMDKRQACLISNILSATESEASVMLLKGPCLVVAAQRDNAVACFETLLNRDYCQKPDVPDCTQRLLYPKAEKQAEELLCCLFDSLTSESIHQIKIQDF